MANPPTYSVLNYQGGGTVSVWPLAGASQTTGSQDGSTVGSGGPALASLEVLANTGFYVANRNIDFLEDRYSLSANAASADSGVYKRDQGGSGLWGRVQGGVAYPRVDGSVSGLHVIHPNGVPTLIYLMCKQSNVWVAYSTPDGVTSSPYWGSSAGHIMNSPGIAGPTTTGQSILFGNDVVWAHEYIAGATPRSIIRWSEETATFTRYDVSSTYDTSQRASNFALHAHENVLFLAGWSTSQTMRLARLQGGAFVTVHTYTQAGGTTSTAYGHSALFTDPHSSGTGELILIMSGKPNAGSGGTAASAIANATGTTPVVRDIATVIPSQYLDGGAEGDQNRRWAINVTETTPGTTVAFLTTWVPGFSTACWQWNGPDTLMTSIASGVGISSNFALPDNAVGGGERSPRTAAVEQDGTPTEVVGGYAKVFFRGQGSAAAGTVTFVGTDKGAVPNTIIPIAAGSLAIVSGGPPPTTPTTSGNTLVNFTPDNGSTLYSVDLYVGASGVDIGSGDAGLIIADFV